MFKVGILSFSDAREKVHKNLSPYIEEVQEKIRAELEKDAQIKIYLSDKIINDGRMAVSQAKKLAAEDIDAAILNVSVFAFPNFSAISANILGDIPVLVFGQKNPQFPGLGGLQAAANMIRQAGERCSKIWGDIEDDKVKKKVLSFIRGAHAAKNLKGQTFGLIGGRSIGMGTGSVNPDIWFKNFGIDVEHIDQLEIIRRMDKVPENKVEDAFLWLKKNTRQIDFGTDKLTEKSLGDQIRSYYATKDIIEEKKLDFVGVKCHYELSEYYNTQCISAAFFNDPYDWEGKKEPVVFSCEADADGALTMQVLKLVSRKPVLFMDFRHFDDEDKLLTLCNCGAMSTWYSRRSNKPEENMAEVDLKPVIEKYAGRGCHVRYIAREGTMTLARLTHIMDKYMLTVFKGRCVNMPEEKLKQSNENWPHCYIKMDASFEDIFESFDNNHIHAVSGDYLEELRHFCRLKDIEFNFIGS